MWLFWHCRAQQTNHEILEWKTFCCCWFFFSLLLLLMKLPKPTAMYGKRMSTVEVGSSVFYSMPTAANNTYENKHNISFINCVPGHSLLWWWCTRTLIFHFVVQMLMIKVFHCLPVPFIGCLSLCFVCVSVSFALCLCLWLLPSIHEMNPMICLSHRMWHVIVTLSDSNCFFKRKR